MKPGFLLDSSACIPVLHNRSGLDKLPDPALTGIPVIVAAELWTGVKKNLKTHPHHAARLEAFLSLFHLPDFDLAAALHYAEIRAALENAHRRVRDAQNQATMQKSRVLQGLGVLWVIPLAIAVFV